MIKIILSTKNPSKAEQIKGMFDGLNLEVLTLDEAGIEGEAIEDGNTLEENAFKKAEYAFERNEISAWTMADDTGLHIAALNGEPGIHAARWAGEDATTAEITAYTLERLSGFSDRSAVFETVAALISPTGERFAFRGKCPGALLEAQRVQPQPKMPYSGIFVADGYDKVWSEMTVPEENAVSHRGKAFQQVRKLFESLS